MLGDIDSHANLAVKDLAPARKFYEEVLGLTPVHNEQDELIVYKSGATTLNVYRSEFAGTNKATAVTWDVGERIDALAKALKDKGVSFKHYDMPGLTLEGDVHVGYGMRVAWFTDPDGNILNLISSSS